MRVALFATCLTDTFFPETAGQAAPEIVQGLIRAFTNGFALQGLGQRSPPFAPISGSIGRCPSNTG